MAAIPWGRLKSQCVDQNCLAPVLLNGSVLIFSSSVAHLLPCFKQIFFIFSFFKYNFPDVSYLEPSVVICLTKLIPKLTSYDHGTLLYGLFQNTVQDWLRLS